MNGRPSGAAGRYAVLGGLAFLILSLAIPGWSTPAGESPEALYGRANALYIEGSYSEAIAIYKELLEVASNNGHLLYNLGNAYYKDGQLGRAILRYEQASQLLPRDEDVRFNLRLARDRTRDKIDVPRHPLLQALSYGQRILTIDEHTVLVFALYLAVAAMLVLRIAAPPWPKWNILSKVFLIALVLLVVCGVSLGANLYVQRAIKEGIVTSPEAIARSGPGEDFTEVFAVHEGTKARLRNVRDQWVQISLPNGLNGWIPSDDVGPL